MFVKETEYKGNPMLAIATTEGERFPFQFGIRKAKMIVESLDAIKTFVEKYGAADESETPEPATTKA